MPALNRQRCRSHARVRIVGHLLQTAHVDQQRVVAHAPDGEAMAARTDADLPAVFTGKTDALDEIVLDRDAQDRDRIAIRVA